MPPLDAFSPHLRIDTLTESRSSPGHQHRPAASRRRRPGQASTPPRRHRRPRHLQRPHTHLLGNADLCAVTTFRMTQWFLPFGRWYSKLDRSNRLRGSRCTRRTPRSSSLRVLPMPLDHPHPPERSTRRHRPTRPQLRDIVVEDQRGIRPRAPAGALLAIAIRPLLLRLMEWRNGCNESLTGRSCAEFLGFAESMSTGTKPIRKLSVRISSYCSSRD